MRTILLSALIHSLTTPGNAWAPVSGISLIERHQRISSEIQGCYESLISLTVPESCRTLIGASDREKSKFQESAMTGFCRRRIVLRYIDEIEGMFAEQIPIKDAGECEPFWTAYNAIPLANRIDQLLGNTMFVSRKAAVVRVMLGLLQRLHQGGFSHGGGLTTHSFGVMEGSLFNEAGRLYDTAVQLTDLHNARSMYTNCGSLNAEVLIAMKQDLFDFSANVISKLFREKSLSLTFKMDVETTRLDARNFNYVKWFQMLRYMQTSGVEVRLQLPIEETVVFPPPEKDESSLFGSLESLFSQCTHRIVDNEPLEQCLDPSLNEIEVADLGKLVRSVESVSPIYSVAGSVDKMVRLEAFDSNVRGHCRTESLLRFLGGLAGFVPRVYALEWPSLVGGCSVVVDVFQSTADIFTLLQSENFRFLYLALGSAISALEALHSKGMVHNGLDSPNAFSVLADGSFKFIRFDKVEFYVDETHGTHFPREVAGTRKSDLASFALLVARALQFRDQTVNALYYEMDALEWNAAPDYHKWISTFESLAVVPSPKRARGPQSCEGITTPSPHYFESLAHFSTPSPLV